MTKKILIFNNLDNSFYEHLLPIALAAQNASYKIVVLTNVTSHRSKIEAHGLKVIHITINRGRINPFLEIITCLRIIRIIFNEKPDILHNFTIKPILYGSIASLFAFKNIKIINNFLGMGFIFISDKFIYQIFRNIICNILSLISKLRQVLYITQNADDRKLLIEYKITKESDIVTQCSVGVDTSKFKALNELQGKIIFALVARMLRDKGVYEFVNAAKILKQKKIDAEFWLVGDIDAQNNSSLSISELEDINNQGYVKYLGFQNIDKIWQHAHVAVLPSYREGLSRSLLEAGAYGRGIITTDAPGGRELITDKINGLLVKPYDAQSLADAMELLVRNGELRKNLGQQIREHIIKYYNSKIIAKKMISFYG